MKARSQRTAVHHGERGYALLMVVFLVTLLLISVVAVAPNILTEGKREKEKEMVWRGKQYARGVKLYYRKMGRFPTSLDDLTKPKTGSLRFMRQAYKDPMNKEDGAWRLIYVGASHCPGGPCESLGRNRRRTAAAAWLKRHAGPKWNATRWNAARWNAIRRESARHFGNGQRDRPE